MKPHHHRLAALSAVILFAGACANPSHLVFLQKTTLGVGASADTSTGRVNVTAGYHRQTNAFVPKTITDGPDRREREAMSTISLSEVKVKFLGVHEVNEQFATGKAAQLMADKPDALGQLTTLSEIAPASSGASSNR
jgi:hypothetical protein